MADKSRPFSIYLLREGFDAENALVDDHGLDTTGGDNLPEGARFYMMDANRKRPWWRSYFGITNEIWQEFKGAILFLPVGERCFAICFGQVYHNLKDVAYEYDFGLRVTLNMLDPKKLRSADMVAPGSARRKRTQVPKKVVRAAEGQGLDTVINIKRCPKSVSESAPGARFNVSV